ncbi:SH3 domain-containing protein, partial [Streptomyces sp. NPDC057654]|uniref:SH3 domain-containing protein n=1 Tax=Streptomyces sp. NPDC057654 TaxID=3346196 RepID=UPI0036B95DF8
MYARRIAMLSATAAAIAMPVLSATAATAAPAHPVSSSTAVQASRPCDGWGPWKNHASAVMIRSKASAASTSLGILYRSHRFAVHSERGSWVNITDKNTGVRGWVSATYVY